MYAVNGKTCPTPENAITFSLGVCGFDPRPRHTKDLIKMVPDASLLSAQLRNAVRAIVVCLRSMVDGAMAMVDGAMAMVDGR